MASTGKLTQSTSFHQDQRVTGWSSAAENIAYVGSASGAKLVDMWIKSAGHSANMSRPNDNVVGVGIAVDDRGVIWGTTTFYQYRTMPAKTELAINILNEVAKGKFGAAG